LSVSDKVHKTAAAIASLESNDTALLRTAEVENLTFRSRVRSLPSAMIVAGSDSGGGAGAIADIKTFSALGVFGTCALTAVTAQNTRGVLEIHTVPPEVVRKQMVAVLEDIPMKVVKTGMLYSEETVEVVAATISKYELRVVVDPVICAGTGDPLISQEGREALVRLLVPLASVVTPNVPEAETIANVRIKELDDMKDAAQRIAELGAEAVIVKGGHIVQQRGRVYDVFYNNERFEVFEKRRLRTQPHGSGCVFSAAMAANLAKGLDPAEAAKKTEELVETSIKHSFKVGSGRVPVNPMACLYNDAEKFRTLAEVEEAAESIEASSEFLPFIAEVGTQIAMALPFASSNKDVAAIEGRIGKFRGRPKAVGSAKFGASRHVANMVLTAMKLNPEIRAAFNLHYDPQLVEAFRKTGCKTLSFDRRLEPKETKAVEGRTLSWGTRMAIQSLGEVPDIIYDEGDVGKEPMIRLLGRSATEAVGKAQKAIKWCRLRG